MGTLPAGMIGRSKCGDFLLGLALGFLGGLLLPARRSFAAAPVEPSAPRPAEMPIQMPIQVPIQMPYEEPVRLDRLAPIAVQLGGIGETR